MVYSFLYVFIFSIALVLIQKLDVSIPPFLSLFVSAIIATMYFNLINLTRLKEIYFDCIKNLTSWFFLMVSVLVMWGSTMVGPGKIGASTFNFLYFAWLGALGFFSLSRQNWRANITKIYFGLIIIFLLIFDISFELYQSNNLQTVVGVILSLIGGTTSFIYFKQSQLFTKKTSLTATQILAVRFYLSIVVLSVFISSNEPAKYFNISNTFFLIILAFFSLIIPLYFSQKALEKITSEQHAIITSLCPAVTAILQAIIFKDLSIEHMIIFVLYSFTIASAYTLNRFRQNAAVSS